MRDDRKLWTSAGGTVYELEEMTEEHLQSAINFMERRDIPRYGNITREDLAKELRRRGGGRNAYAGPQWF